jgi:hypothetical protein
MPFASAPVDDKETRWMRHSLGSKAKMSPTPLVSPGTRLVASDWNTMTVPSVDTSGAIDGPFASVPSKTLVIRTMYSAGAAAIWRLAPG